MISVICPFNNKVLLEKCLLESLHKQKEEFEIILVDSKLMGFTSAVQAINYGCNMAKGEYFAIIHQDIVFESDSILSEILDYCNNLDFGIMGIAGVPEKAKNVYSKIVHGKNKTKAGEDRFSSPIRAGSLDECLIVIKRDVFLNHHFNDLGNTWHLYATDYVLTMKKNKLNAYIIPIDNIWHKSAGDSLSVDYFEAIQRLAEINKDSKILYTCMGYWPTNPVILSLKCKYRKLRLKKRGY